jgi:hypothetical protein
MTAISRVIVGLCVVATLGGCEMFRPTGQTSGYEDSLSAGPWQQKGVLLRFTPPKTYQGSQVSVHTEMLEDER